LLEADRTRVPTTDSIGVPNAILCEVKGRDSSLVDESEYDWGGVAGHLSYSSQIIEISNLYKMLRQNRFAFFNRLLWVEISFRCRFSKDRVVTLKRT
jgi:hypothetical protein